MKPVLSAFAASFLILTGVAQAEVSSPSALAEKGKALSGTCAGCHGADGVSLSPQFPSLAGLPAAYIARQLEHYKSGQRENAVMKGFASALSSEDMRALGAYYQSLKPRPAGARDMKLAQSAERLYRGGDAARGLPACAGCHSPTGAGIPQQYPRIGGQHAEYTSAQLLAFKNGQRGKPSEKDANLPGRMMMQIAAKLTEEEIKALAEYAAGLKPNY
ncbi:MAG: cytochrome c4 [Casimicrobiaceae bacterium]|nr:cytochrome c4 [Casimicrobiaceae bacterium]MDW8311729.1 c-type cytochrome [Burkholderiales bacterium]